jgi:hypothetical protein
MSERKVIPIEECKHGYLYYIQSRNLSIGVFNKDNDNGLIGVREKFGSRYLFTEFHYDNGPPFGTAKPILELGPVPEGMLVADRMPDLWIKEEDDTYRRVLRRQGLKPNELPHGTRKGFVDEWADTGERIPDALYPHIRNNKELFDFLEGFKPSEDQQKLIDEMEDAWIGP